MRGLNILWNMIKEEWRIHAVLSGGFMFAFFPLLITVFVFAGLMFLPYIRIVFPTEQLAILVHYLFLLVGLSVGAFGLLGKEVMNRRFGQASLIAYSSRSLPVSERNIFINFFVKDIIYYFILWIVPFVLGFAFAAPLLAISIAYAPLILITLTLSFLIGLSASFLLSTIYAHSGRVLFALLALAGLLAVNCPITWLLLPSLSFFFAPSYSQMILCIALIAIPSLLSMIFLKIDYPEKKRRFSNSLNALMKIIPFRGYSQFISKDLLDLHRSQGGPGKIIFSFLIPLAIIWPMLMIFFKFVPIANPLIIFSVLLGAISSTIYNWLTEFDLFTSYSFLPVKSSTLIKGKVRCYAVINTLSFAILAMAAVLSGHNAYFLPSLSAFIAVSSYTLSITVYLTGLHPNILLYNAKIFLAYVASISPVLLAMIFVSVINPAYLTAGLAVLPFCYYLIGQSYKKWDSTDYLSF